MHHKKIMAAEEDILQNQSKSLAVITNNQAPTVKKKHNRIKRGN